VDFSLVNHNFKEPWQALQACRRDGTGVLRCGSVYVWENEALLPFGLVTLIKVSAEATARAECGALL